MGTSSRFWVVVLTAGLTLCAGCSESSNTPPAPQSTLPPPPSAPPTPPPPMPVTVTSEIGVVYGTGQLEFSTADLLLDIYQPDGPCTELRPFVIGIHGGGFVGGSRNDSNWVANMEAAVARGFVGISIDYRLVGDAPLVGAEFLPIRDDFTAAGQALGLSETQLDVLNAAAAAIEDAVTAIRWAEDNAQDRCLDINRFAIWGSSAGAITALHVAHGLDEYFINRPDPLVAIDFWGRLLLDGLVDTNGPPIMIVHGTADQSQIYEDTALVLAAEAENVGVPFAFYTIEGGPHGFGTINPDRVQINGQAPLDVTLDFIEAHLLDGAPLYEVVTIIPTP